MLKRTDISAKQPFPLPLLMETSVLPTVPPLESLLIDCDLSSQKPMLVERQSPYSQNTGHNLSHKRVISEEHTRSAPRRVEQS